MSDNFTELQEYMGLPGIPEPKDLGPYYDNVMTWSFIVFMLMGIGLMAWGIRNFIKGKLNAVPRKD